MHSFLSSAELEMDLLDDDGQTLKDTARAGRYFDSKLPQASLKQICIFAWRGDESCLAVRNVCFLVTQAGQMAAYRPFANSSASYLSTQGTGCGTYRSSVTFIFCSTVSSVWYDINHCRAISKFGDSKDNTRAMQWSLIDIDCRYTAKGKEGGHENLD